MQWVRTLPQRSLFTHLQQQATDRCDRAVRYCSASFSLFHWSRLGLLCVWYDGDARTVLLSQLVRACHHGVAASDTDGYC